MIHSASARSLLLGSSILPCLALLAAAPAAAQVAGPPQTDTATAPGATTPQPGATPGTPAAPNGTAGPTQGADAGASVPDVVVTGTIFRRTNTETPSPVTVLSADTLAERGINTVTDAVRSISADGAGTLPTSFSANGAFAQGAATASLRGLTSDSTLVVFDGLRGAYYPFADDGTRSFVDLNTIPDAIVERVEVLKDGASSTYGADAIAGVVNIITKKEIKGVQLDGSAGITTRGDAGEQRITATAGYGDLKSQGFNVYISGEYQHDAMLMNNARGYPYNTTDLSRSRAIDGTTPDANNNQNGQGVAANQATISAIVRPATLTDPTNILSGVAIANGATQILSPTGCALGTAFVNGGATGNYCQQDIVNQYGVIQPDQERLGVTGHLTVNVGSHAQAYLIGTYYRNRVTYGGAPESTAARQPTTLRNIVLPALLANGQVNPQDPYANIIDPATGQRESALLQYRFGDIAPLTRVTSETYRVAGGIDGTFGQGWSYSAAATYMKVNLDNFNAGLLNYNALINAINTGAYNFANPAANTAAVRAAIAPDLDTKANSELWQVQGVLTKDLFQLPGGPLQVGVGGQVRHESIYDPIQDPLSTNQQYSQYTTADVNTFNAIGSRYVEAAFFEINAPILKQLEVNASGRYDHYSSGFDHFSPKVGAKFTPIRELAFRGTFSKGFRAPSIPESSGNVIGYVNVTPPTSAVNDHCNVAVGAGGTCASPDGYVKTYGVGEFSAGNPDLKPETSQSFTAGTIIQPKRWLSFTVDYFNIQKRNLIIGGADFGDAIAAYYASGGTNLAPLPGYTILQNPADPQHPNGVRTVQVVSALYENAQRLLVDGIDFTGQVDLHITPNVRFTSSAEATLNLRYNIYTDGGVERFVGTLGPDNYTAGSGTPRWRANWQNTVEVGKYALTATAYYTDGYIAAADDVTGPGTASGSAPCAVGGAAAGLAAASDGATPEVCRVHSYIQLDLTSQVKVNDRFTLYANVSNLLDAHAPFDPAQYSANNYNPAWANGGVIGRFIRIGARATF